MDAWLVQVNCEAPSLSVVLNEPTFLPPLPLNVKDPPADEMKELQGTGTQLKEVRIIDHRPSANGNGNGANVHPHNPGDLQHEHPNGASQPG